MTSLWTPTRAQKEARQAEAAALLSRVHRELGHFNYELQRFDPYLQVVRADPRADHRLLRPGYYHLLRIPPDGPPTVEVWEGDDGEFRELGSDLFEWLRHADLWNDRSRRQREKRQRELKRLAERERELETEDRRQEMYERLMSKNNVSIQVPG